MRGGQRSLRVIGVANDAPIGQRHAGEALRLTGVLETQRQPMAVPNLAQAHRLTTM